jgi:hypothetical protein
MGQFRDIYCAMDLLFLVQLMLLFLQPLELIGATGMEVLLSISQIYVGASSAWGIMARGVILIEGRVPRVIQEVQREMQLEQYKGINFILTCIIWEIYLAGQRGEIHDLTGLRVKILHKLKML